MKNISALIFIVPAAVLFALVPWALAMQGDNHGPQGNRCNIEAVRSCEYSNREKMPELRRYIDPLSLAMGDAYARFSERGKSLEQLEKSCGRLSVVEQMIVDDLKLFSKEASRPLPNQSIRNRFQAIFTWAMAEEYGTENSNLVRYYFSFPAEAHRWGGSGTGKVQKNLQAIGGGISQNAGTCEQQLKILRAEVKDLQEKWQALHNRREPYMQAHGAAEQMVNGGCRRAICGQ